METDEVEELLVGLILEGKVEGRIDQVAMRLELDRKSVTVFSLKLDRSKLICSFSQLGKSWRSAGTMLWTNGQTSWRMCIPPSLARILAQPEGRKIL